MYFAQDNFRRTACVRSLGSFTSFVYSLWRNIAGRWSKSLHAKRNLTCVFKHNLIELRPDHKEAVFENLDSKEQRVIPFDMVHITAR